MAMTVSVADLVNVIAAHLDGLDDPGTFFPLLAENLRTLAVMLPEEARATVQASITEFQTFQPDELGTVLGGSWRPSQLHLEIVPVKADEADAVIPLSYVIERAAE